MPRARIKPNPQLKQIVLEETNDGRDVIRHFRRTYLQMPFKRVHPEEWDGSKTDMAASTAQLYRLVKEETNHGSDIIIRFVDIMKGCHP